MLQLGQKDSLSPVRVVRSYKGESVLNFLSLSHKEQNMESCKARKCSSSGVGVSEGGEDGQFCLGSESKTRVVSFNILGKYI